LVRIVRLGHDPIADVGGLTGALYHSDASHHSFRLLSDSGLDVRPIDNGQLLDGTLLVPRFSGPFYDLVHIVNRLLGPGGCPWDIEQTHATLKRHLLEETYEVLEAIDSGDASKLREELGDLLLQPLMHAQMEQRDSDWGVDEVATALTAKLVRRHPHVFGEASASDSGEVLRNWDRIKKSEKSPQERSILSGVPSSMPSLLRAYEVSKRAARSGFEWPNLEGVFAKLREEEAELVQALESQSPELIESEVGDLLFTIVNIARWAGVEPEDALRRMVDRFISRFQLIEAGTDKELSDLSPEEWDVLWNSSKRQLAAPSGIDATVRQT
jgi:tetrapyrrole methylase family protein / MazG family protein